MLNQSEVITKSGTTRKTILVDLNNTTSVSCMVADTGVGEVDGKKMILAGTPLAGDLTNRDVPFTVASGSDATCILLHDVEVTNGTANAQAVVFGFIDVTKLDETVVAKLTREVKAALNMIKFIG